MSACGSEGRSSACLAIHAVIRSRSSSGTSSLFWQTSGAGDSEWARIRATGLNCEERANGGSPASSTLMDTSRMDALARDHFAMIDEVDSVLIDDARTPLIISGPTPKGDIHEFNELKPKVDQLVSLQNKYLVGLLAEARKLIADGNTKEGGFFLYRVFRGIPKNKALIKFLSQKESNNSFKKRRTSICKTTTVKCPRLMRNCCS